MAAVLRGSPDSHGRTSSGCTLRGRFRTLRRRSGGCWQWRPGLPARGVQPDGTAERDSDGSHEHGLVDLLEALANPLLGGSTVAGDGRRVASTARRSNTRSRVSYLAPIVLISFNAPTSSFSATRPVVRTCGRFRMFHCPDMEEFSAEGDWWLPDAQAQRVPGSLTLDADGVQLVLYGPLHPFVMPANKAVRVGRPKRIVTPIVHGRLRDMRNVTLVGVSGYRPVAPFGEVREVYRVGLALFGWHASDDAFTEAWAEFDWLDAWLDPPPIVNDSSDLGTNTVTVQQASVELAKAEVDGDTVRFVSGLRGTSSEAAIHLDRWSALAVTLATPLDWKNIIERRIRPIQDLLTVAIGRPVRLTKLLLRPIDTDRSVPLCEAQFNIIQAASTSRSRHGLDNYTAPTLFKGSDPTVSLDQLLPAWFDLWQRDRDALVRLFAQFYAPFMYGDHTFATTFQAFEALHKHRFNGRQLNKSAHDDRVAAIKQAAIHAGIDAETVEWAAAVLQGRNDKRLADKISELVRATGPVGAAVLAAAPSFSQTVTGGRTGVSHGGVRHRLNTEERHWHGEVMQWVARSLLLADAGSPNVADRTVDRMGFRHAVEQIREKKT